MSGRDAPGTVRAGVQGRLLLLPLQVCSIQREFCVGMGMVCGLTSQKEMSRAQVLLFLLHELRLEKAVQVCVS